MSYISKQPRVLVRNAGQTIATGTVVPIEFNLKVYDTDNMVNLVASSTKININSPGAYELLANVLWGSNSTGYRWAFIEHYNISDVRYRYISSNINSVSGGETAQSVCGSFICNGGDYFLFSLLHNKGSNQDMADASVSAERKR